MSESRLRTELTALRWLPWELSTVEEAAERAGVSVGSFVRDEALVRAAAQSKGDRDG